MKLEIASLTLGDLAVEETKSKKPYGKHKFTAGLQVLFAYKAGLLTL
ncbi:MAG: hypothetical protein R6V34_02425 [Bacteroidales bacterium]